MLISYKKTISGLLMAGALAVGGCQKDTFVDTNIDPESLTSVPPANQFLNATLGIHNQDFEAFYDTYQRIMPWMQYATGVSGNGQNFTQVYDNFSQRYGRLYSTTYGVGNTLTDLERLVGNLSTEDQARYVHMVRIARILKAYYTFYVSDIYGSIPYSQAFQARYGGTLTPTYDRQEAIFAALDTELKEAIATLKTAQPAAQVALGTNDQYYAGNTQQWVKAANALRLKIALRLVKRDAAKLRTIAQEVLASPAADLMSSNADSWMFVAPAGFTSGGNWNPDESGGMRASKPLVDFMVETQDPRLDAFFTPNNYSQENIDRLITDRQLPAGTRASARRYVGSFTSPDAARTALNVRQYYTPRFVTISGARTAIDTVSNIQRRLFQPSYAINGTVGDGRGYFPVISYADFCFMRAELAAQTLTTEAAKTWYDAGVMASLDWYDTVAQGSKLTEYTAMTATEKTAYLAAPKVAYNAARGLDLIASQAYIHFMKQPSEGWAQWKRTGLPNATSTLALPALLSNGATLVVPRRAPLGLPNPSEANFANRQAAYADMAKETGFGTDPQDATGRVWWDRP